MTEESRDKSEGKLRVEQMPPVVKRLVDAMTGVDPYFDIEEWLIRKANEDLVIPVSYTHLTLPTILRV